ncbi:Phospho-2-dehydro-3-deoxyheptonate aldolase [Zhongshania aliphaticivorans]|uniref:Phospho-2-dehydro-3-deoxyheptonate aldolase n=1 Tax=Zhongshania aliphaticivorans TaxID=1470434 RepID=A0A5S9QFG3_9GAMM|nr:3-deoxy-7-phosphoheptulonate synthase [Zhongshania aliphaticivorans]CAA0088374.1 Phospho-2-dehydro-3-deoxyheptonate aldolase [Zhongshania aliphaticivorans]CAA0116429.1 Phospho-2-dehydro-3-deoxyheptonate aldolase [Zhongshania aliphaticivorans]CAA0120472.1 Phospho-2-dehydro-3-deoxyheptonate aldolase [Zhongshania aliphaticivorans]
MLLILHPNIKETDPEYLKTITHLQQLDGIKVQHHHVNGQQQQLHEIYLLGNTLALDLNEIETLPAVEKVIRISEEYRILGRHNDLLRHTGFHYKGLNFDQDSLHIFAGLCAVDTPKHVEEMMIVLKANGLNCTRMGAYKPRTNPYAFQGHGKQCLPWVFDLAGKYGIKVIAMEVTHESHMAEIDQALKDAGHPCGVIMQIGTRNTQNFELLKAIGKQKNYPALLKRGFGITLNESLNAAEYLASEGNSQVIFCLRGMKSDFGAPHRNMVDFAQVPTVKRLTRMPVCIDPSHSVGSRDIAPDGVLELCHATAQGVLAGANMVLVDFHPKPQAALVDGPQALTLNELDVFLKDMEISRKAYLSRVDAWKQNTTSF